MRLRNLRIESAPSCGGLLDGLSISFARSSDGESPLEPLCLIGPNGSGKSQFLQVIAEIFQAAWHIHAPHEERDLVHFDTYFDLEYEIELPSGAGLVTVRLERLDQGKLPAKIEMWARDGADWVLVSPNTPKFGALLPSLIIGYTSGDNETLSLPFLFSRSGYAKEVGRAAFEEAAGSEGGVVPDNRLLLVDYGTHLEVLVANLILGDAQTREAILDHANLQNLSSCRCIIQLNHSAAPKIKKTGSRKGVQLTRELEGHIESLKRCATCWDYDERLEVYTFDFIISDATVEAFKYYFQNSLNLYRAFHKLALLNDLAIPRKARERLLRDARERRFASTLPEPQDEDKVFRFEQVSLYKRNSETQKPVDYVSLSDGEHQQTQILGIFAMLQDANALFLLDEPESHFNPLWRVKFVKKLMELPGKLRGRQEVLITSHAPFVPSDMTRQQVLIFSKGSEGLEVNHPQIETFGASFDRILEHCFGVQPPISQLARDEISRLMEAGSADEIRHALNSLGSSVEKAFLADRLRQLEARGST